MAQNHMELPWFANIKSYGDKLAQHLQGMLSYNRSMTINRTFHNFKNTSNLAIHCFLCALEDTYKLEGKLPDTIFLQIDGGSENTSKATLGIAELLVARRLTKNVVITRLIVGHTHEDIDAVFGKIWYHNRNRSLLSPQVFAESVLQSLSKRGTPSKIVDIFVVPDYVKYIMPHVDPIFSGYCKKEQTQHMFTFEAVVPCPDFPHGVKMTYRAYASDKIHEIHTNPDEMCGFTATNVFVSNQPESYIKDDGTVVPEGMYLLHSLPTDSGIEPVEFLKDTNRKIHDHWKEFRDVIAPQSDDVREYLTRQRDAGVEDYFHVPFINELFSGSEVDLINTVPSLITTDTNTLNNYKATPSIVWGQRNSLSKKKNAMSGDETQVGGAQRVKMTKKSKSVLRKTQEGVPYRLPCDEFGNLLTPEASNSCTCACYPADNCTMKGIDVSGSQHKCFWCSRKISALCVSFEDTIEIACRFCYGQTFPQGGLRYEEEQNHHDDDQPTDPYNDGDPSEKRLAKPKKQRKSSKKSTLSSSTSPEEEQETNQIEAATVVLKKSRRDSKTSKSHNNSDEEDDASIKPTTNKRKMVMTEPAPTRKATRNGVRVCSLAARSALAQMQDDTVDYNENPELLIDARVYRWLPYKYNDERDKTDFPYGDLENGEFFYARVNSYDKPYFTIEYEEDRSLEKVTLKELLKIRI
eukprot:gene12238-25709_t